MSSIYTNDLLSQKDQLSSEITSLEKLISDKRVLIWFLDNLIKQAQLRDTETNGPSSWVPSKKNISISNVPKINSVDNTQDEIINFLSSQPWKQARTAVITGTLAPGNRDKQLKVSNAMTQLCKYWKLQIIKEYDTTGVERQRNRLYQLTSLV